MLENEKSYAAEYAAAKEIAELLAKVNEDDKPLAKAKITSFIEGFIASDIYKKKKMSA